MSRPEAETLIDPKVSDPSEVLLWQQMLLVVPGQSFWSDAEILDIEKRADKLKLMMKFEFDIELHHREVARHADGVKHIIYRVTRTK